MYRHHQATYGEVHNLLPKWAREWVHMKAREQAALADTPILFSPPGDIQSESESSTALLHPTTIVIPSPTGGPTTQTVTTSESAIPLLFAPAGFNATSKSSKTSSKPQSSFVAAYYPDWTTMDPEAIDFSRFDWIDFAFAVPNASFVPILSDEGSGSLLTRLVTAAHASGKKVKLSVGGWTGSKYFSPAVASSDSRKTFANNILQLYNKYNVDGIDLDWEYPGAEGNLGNIWASSDSANYLQFLKVLRSTLPTDAVITAATQVWPFTGPDGQPMSDVSAFARYLDWILIMNYDVWGSSSNPGPNAPLSNACGNSTQPLANAVAAIDSWTKAGMPANKLTLGVPSYGYISQSTATQLYGRDLVEVENEDGGQNGGQIQFNELIKQAALQKQDGVYVGGDGFQRFWDSCSSTPFLRSASAGQVITYDDPESLQMKAEFAKSAGIKGINMFDAHGDTDSWELVDALRRGLGVI